MKSPCILLLAAALLPAVVLAEPPAGGAAPAAGVAAAPAPDLQVVPVSETPDGPVDRRVWRGEPLAIDLPLGVERSLRFPGAASVRAGLVGGPVPGLRIQSLGDRVFLLAREPFKVTRLLAQTETGGSYLLDLSTKPAAQASADPVEIHGQVAAAQAAPGAPGVQAAARPVGYVELVRHAAQSLYGPERLIPRGGTVFRVPVRGVGAHLPIVRGGRVSAEPLVAWRADGHRGPLWVTAVRLCNTTATPLDLDPRDLRGQWLAATFQHGHLGATGRETDTTTLYLVSGTPFHEALGAFFTAQAGEGAR